MVLASTQTFTNAELNSFRCGSSVNVKASRVPVKYESIGGNISSSCSTAVKVKSKPKSSRWKSICDDSNHYWARTYFNSAKSPVCWAVVTVALAASRGARTGWAAWCDGACSQACHDGCSHPTTNFRLKTWFSLKVLAGERFNRWAAELASWKRLTLAFDMSTLTGQSEMITSMALITRLYAVQLVASAEIESILS